MAIIDFIKDNWLIISPIIYEILVRAIPTKWNASIIDYIIGILNAIVENKRIPQPGDVPAPNEKGNNLIAVKSTRWFVK